MASAMPFFLFYKLFYLSLYGTFIVKKRESLIIVLMEEENMNKNITFTPLDLQTWKRGELFYYFSKIAPTGYSLTVDLDITLMMNTLKSAGIKFFPAYLWLVTKTLNLQTEFKIAEKDGQIGYYDTLTPLYASFHKDDNTFSLMWTEFDNDFNIFYHSYLENQKHYGNHHGILSQKELPPPENAYTVSCIPWISFHAFSVHSYDNKPYYFPSVEAGKFYKKEEHMMLPLSITCHHAATDGYHIDRFLNTLQSDADMFHKYLSK